MTTFVFGCCPQRPLPLDLLWSNCYISLSSLPSHSSPATVIWILKRKPFIFLLLTPTTSHQRLETAFHDENLCVQGTLHAHNMIPMCRHTHTHTHTHTRASRQSFAQTQILCVFVTSSLRLSAYHGLHHSAATSNSPWDGPRHFAPPHSPVPYYIYGLLLCRW